MSAKVAVSCGKPEDAARYTRALAAVGLDPVVICPAQEQSLAGAGVAGLLLSGGTDIDSALYDQPPAPESEPPDRARDALEQRLLAEALSLDLPVFAICRGMQLMNVAMRGTLQQHHPYQTTHRVRTPEDPARPAHDVAVRPGTRLAGILGEGLCSVNSRHHQGVERVAAALTVCATAPDGMVEAVELEGRAFVLGVQWHPEDQMEKNGRQRKLFQEFERAVTAAAGGSAR